MIGLLLFFEFIAIFTGPLFSKLTNNVPVLSFLVLVFVAALLIPVHSRLQKWVIKKLAHKTKTLKDINAAY